MQFSFLLKIKPWQWCCIKTYFIDRMRLYFFFMWFCLRCRGFSCESLVLSLWFWRLFSFLCFLSLLCFSHSNSCLISKAWPSCSFQFIPTSLLCSFLTSPVFCNPSLHVVQLMWVYSLSLCQVVVSVCFTSVVLFYLFGSFIGFFPTRTKQVFFQGHTATLYPSLHP